MGKDRIDLLVDNVSKGLDLLFKEGPDDLSYFIVIYARDPLDKRDDYPDGYTRIKSRGNSGYFDRCQIGQYIQEKIWRTE